MTSTLTELRKIATSYWEAPKDDETISRNLFRLSIWGTIGSGATALVSFIFSRSLVQEGSWKKFGPYIFTASLASCGTFALSTAFLGYKIGQITRSAERADSFRKLNAQVVSLETGFVIASSVAYFAAFLGQSCLNPNQVIKSLAGRFCAPLAWITMTICAIGIFHDSQLNRRL